MASDVPKRPANENNNVTEKCPWEEIYAEEHERIRARRRVAFGFEQDGFPNDPAASQKPIHDLFGLALSGGGIRSALFNEGFLQALSHRGLLRWVDYLCTVSGGGYIGGHLTASGLLKMKDNAARGERSEAGTQSFHDDRDCYRMGKHPQTGELESGRLDDVGNYLAKKPEMIASYLASQVLALAFYVGMVGTFATLIALAWRSLDHTLYRRALGLLGFDWGDELFVAFLPAIWVLIVWLLSTLARAVVLLGSRYLSSHRHDGREYGLINLWRSVNKWISMAVIACVAIGVAVFLGNGWTSVRRDGENFHLNQFAMWLLSSAIISQIAVFMGRHRLFRSEKVESPRWQQMGQHIVAYACLGLAIFAMIHWMSREDISHYTEFRDPHLVRAEVLDWHNLTGIGKRLGIDAEAEAVRIAMRRSEASAINFQHGERSNWQNFEEYRPFAAFGPSTSVPPSPWEATPDGIMEVMSVPPEVTRPSVLTRWRALLHTTAVEFFIGPLWAGREPQFAEDDAYRYYPELLGKPIDAAREEWGLKDNFLRALNRRLQERSTAVEFLDYLLSRNGDDHQLTFQPGIVGLTLPVSIVYRSATQIQRLNQQRLGIHEQVTLIAEDRSDWMPARTEDLRRDIEWLLGESSNLGQPIRVVQSDEGPQSGAPFAPEDIVTEERIVRLNRNLLDLMHPGMLFDISTASTPVVVRHDQLHRQRWLLFWVCMWAVGFVGTLNLNRHMAVYRYYRRMLGEKFLVGWIGPKRPELASAPVTLAKTSLSKCDPTPAGLPYPLILGSLLRSNFRSDGDVKKCSFLFTPKYYGITDGNEEFAEKTDSFCLPYETQPVSLVDAITISGAAFAPLMTQNKALRILLDFFNVRLGQWIRKPDSQSAKPSRFGFFLGYLSVACETFRANSKWRHGFVADGGFVDYLGVHELLRRRCRLIIATDAGSNLGNSKLQALATLLESAEVELGVKFIDLDHEAPIDFGRLMRSNDREVPQPFLCMRIRYPKSTEGPLPERELTGYFIYVQMATTTSDPLVVRQIRDRFPNFPDEPTQNQFYSEEQVSAYRELGYHIGNRVCGELLRWSPAEISAALTFHKVVLNSKDVVDHAADKSMSSPAGVTMQTNSLMPNVFLGWRVESNDIDILPEHKSGNESPLFDTILRRLKTSFRMACYEENSYRKDDIFAEAVWYNDEWCFPTFDRSAAELVMLIGDLREDDHLPPHRRLIWEMRRAADCWLSEYEGNADVRGAYRRAVLLDTDSAILPVPRTCFFAGLELYDYVVSQRLEAFQGEIGSPAATRGGAMKLTLRDQMVMVAHLCALAVACQQLHRGTPHSIFQIGGREKLIDLVISIVRGDRIKRSDMRWAAWLRASSAEIVEMRRCVFAGAQVETVVSFAYLLTMHVIGITEKNVVRLPKPQRRREMFQLIKNDQVEHLPTKFDQMLRDVQTVPR